MSHEKFDKCIPNKVELSSFEKILEKIFLGEIQKEKFIEIISRLLISFLEELNKYEDLLIEFKNFFSKKGLKLTNENFENSRKLINFFNGIIRFLVFFNRIESLNLKIKEDSDKINPITKNNFKQNILTNIDLINEIKKNCKKIFDIFAFFEKSNVLDFKKIIEFENLKNLKIKELFEIKFNELDKNRCHLCLHDLDVDLKTNIFSKDFHIICINYWINIIDNNSPFN